MDLGGGRPGPTGPIYFLPRDTATVTGHLFDPTAATPVTLSWGADGPVIGQATIDSQGGWTLTFVIPADTQRGTYILYAVAYGADGQVINGLPARVALPVGAPQTSPPRSTRPPAPAKQPATRPRTHVAPTPSAPAERTIAPIPPTAVTTQTGPPRTKVVRYGEQPRLIPVALPATPAAGHAPSLPVAAPAHRGTPWYVLALGALGLVVLGAAAGGLVVSRRAPPNGPPDALDAELQEMIAEERARQTARVD